MAPAPGFVHRNPFACIALAVAVAALALTILPVEIIEPPGAATAAPTGLKRLVKDLVLGGKAPSPEHVAYQARLRSFRIAGLATAIAAIALAIVGAARRESRILAISAAALAGLALTWQYVATGIVVAIVVVFIIGVLGGAS